ncbi:MAG TPA: hypothetical protein PL174_01070 [Fervidobacterium sp.]|jgi:hypothetical protein|nr:hypothetical protein [Fervidobacterium sp.]NLH38198.1 hypothetical protein [Thermotogaceae bacterium]MBP9517961.1 hypothetical protein [Fervidobacterium sp.]HOA16616.1 hypothetical protein [Fervidobacterium sp.]HOH53198.1 hypothetical protein [Fervidobacterium sp.]
MVYTEIIFALLILMLLIVMIFGTIPLQNETLNEAIRQEKAQIMAENMFWETVDATYLQNRPDHFNVDFEVEVDGHKYLVTINALKYERPEK